MRSHKGSGSFGLSVLRTRLAPTLHILRALGFCPFTINIFQRLLAKLNFAFGSSICNFTFAFSAEKTFINVSMVTLLALLSSHEIRAF
jgi:hypothetical protein